jgi:integrase
MNTATERPRPPAAVHPPHWKPTDSLEDVFRAVYTLPARRGVSRPLLAQSKLNARHWRYFFEWWSDCFFTPATVADVTGEQLEVFVEKLRERGRPPAVLRVVVRKFVALWRCLCRERIVGTWPPHPAPMVDDAGNLVWGGVRTWPKSNRPRKTRRRKPAVPKPQPVPHLAKLAAELPQQLEASTPLAGLVLVYCRRKLVGGNPATPAKYDRARRYLEELLGRSATIADLTEDNLVAVAQYKIGGGRSVATGKEYRAKLRALANFAFRRGAMPTAPDLPALREPRRVPFAWTMEQLGTMFAAVRECPQVVHGEDWELPFAVWLCALLLCIWDSGERLGALLRVEWHNLDWTSGRLIVPAEVRKGRTEDKSFSLHPQTLAALKVLHDARKPTAGNQLVFEWPHSVSTLNTWYRRILRGANLPHGRKQMFHAMRRTVASFYKAAGGDPTRLLGHSTPAVTEVYLSPVIVETPQPANVLFRPSGPR